MRIRLVHLFRTNNLNVCRRNASTSVNVQPAKLEQQPAVLPKLFLAWRSGRLCTLGAISALVCTGPATAHADTVYKIVDSAGTVTYSDRPAEAQPRLRAARTVMVVAGTKPATGASGTTRN